MIKNNLEFKICAIYNDSPNLPQIEFKKINENDFIYGSMKVKITHDARNTNNVTGIIFYYFFKNFFNFF